MLCGVGFDRRAYFRALGLTFPLAAPLVPVLPAVLCVVVFADAPAELLFLVEAGDALCVDGGVVLWQKARTGRPSARARPHTAAG
jgi:hypothetical protein